MERFRARIGLDAPLESPVAYVDRQGQLHLPSDVTLDLGRRFCAVDPSTVLVVVEVTERDWTHRAGLVTNT